MALQWLSRAYLYDEQKKTKKNEIEDCIQSASAYYRNNQFEETLRGSTAQYAMGRCFWPQVTLHLLLQMRNLTCRRHRIRRGLAPPRQARDYLGCHNCTLAKATAALHHVFSGCGWPLNTSRGLFSLARVICTGSSFCDRVRQPS